MTQERMDAFTTPVLRMVFKNRRWTPDRVDQRAMYNQVRDQINLDAVRQGDEDRFLKAASELGVWVEWVDHSHALPAGQSR